VKLSDTRSLREKEDLLDWLRPVEVPLNFMLRSTRVGKRRDRVSD